jgi:hypothetical protein
MSDTPRTDEEEFDTEDICNGGPMAVTSEFARELERELDAAIKMLTDSTERYIKLQDKMIHIIEVRAEQKEEK